MSVNAPWLSTPMSQRGWVARSVERADALRTSTTSGRRNASGAIPSRRVRTLWSVTLT